MHGEETHRLKIIYLLSNSNSGLSAPWTNGTTTSFSDWHKETSLLSSYGHGPR